MCIINVSILLFNKQIYKNLEIIFNDILADLIRFMFVAQS